MTGTESLRTARPGALDEAAIGAQMEAALLRSPLDTCANTHVGIRHCSTGKLGGDFYAVLSGANGETAIALGSIESDGMHAALAKTVILATLRALGARLAEPLDVVQAVNEMLCHLNADLRSDAVSARLFFGVESCNTFTYVNAGMPAPLVWTDQGHVVELEATANLLGRSSRLVGRQASCGEGVLKQAIFYTPGVPAARRDGVGFGVNRLRRELERGWRGTVDDEAERLATLVREHVGIENKLEQDVTILVAEFAVERRRVVEQMERRLRRFTATLQQTPDSSVFLG